MPEVFVHYVLRPLTGFEAWLIGGLTLALLGAAGLVSAVIKKITVSIAFTRVAPHAAPLMWLFGAHVRPELRPYGIADIIQSLTHFAVLWVIGSLLFVAAARIGASFEVPNAMSAVVSWFWILPGFYLQATAAALSDDVV